MANRRNYSVTLTSGSQVWVGHWTKGPTGQSAKASRNGSDYSRRKPKGWKSPTDYSMTEEINVEPRGSSITYEKNGKIHGGTTGNLNVRVGANLSHYSYLRGVTNLQDVNTFPSGLSNIAIQKAYSKIKGSNLNLGQAWAERGQTAGLIEQNIARIVGDVRRLRRNPMVLRDIARGANRVVKSLPDWWLEVVFGWKPLISDVYGAVTELDNRPKDHYMVVGKGKAEKRSEARGIFPPTPTSPQQSVDAQCFHGAFCRIDAQPSSDALAKASSLGLTNPLSLAWELLPWSFAVDWFVPIGPYFDNLDVPLGWDIRGMSVSRFSRFTMRRSGTSTGPHPDGTYDVNSFGASYRKVILSRSNDVVLPYANLPRFKDPFNSAQRVGTALALLGQVFRP